MNHEDVNLSISRVVDRRETLGDWERLEQDAAADPDLWRRIAFTLRDDCELRVAVSSVLGGALARAERVEVGLPGLRPSPRQAARTWFAGAAAVLLIGIACLMLRAPAPAAAPDELFTTWLEAAQRAGIVLDQLPNETLDVRPAADGEGVDVIYVRRLVERTRIREAWRVATDEHGEPQAARVDLASFRPGASF